MTVEQLLKQLEFFPKDMEVNIEMNINGVEFDCPIINVYDSEKCYLFGKGDFEITKESCKRWWGWS